ncbi:hypothetical protein FGIG_01572 [Fasciola gigantica]|uniref:Ig-like domain-containing protein n=1 Tax=Fasciola gigantica TaxID=46835 RepID=A0A504YBJ4_FASGI|nr:hypothetical protein FGIG_01572 [Fasciola gigantica]
MPRRILTRGPLRVTRDNRIHLLPQTVMNTSEFPLIIDPVREQDAGEYRCLFQLGSELHHKVVILVVKVPPYFEQRPAKLVKADERGNLRLFCNASGAPQPKIRWWVRLSLPPAHEPLISSTPEGNRSGTTRVSSSENDENSLLVGKERLRPIEIMLSRYRNDIFVRGGLLVFSRLNRHMSGWYLCEADNGISPAALSLSRVLVRYPPEIRMSNSEIQQHLGGSTIIGCTVRAYPSGSVEWELNGVPIQAPYCGYFEVKKLKYCQIEYHKYAGEFSSLVDPLPNSRVNTVGSFYTGADNILPRRMDPDDHEFYRLSDVRLTVANITHSDLGLYTCRVRTSAGVGEGYTRLDAHRFKFHSSVRIEENLLYLSKRSVEFWNTIPKGQGIPQQNNKARMIEK